MLNWCNLRFDGKIQRYLGKINLSCRHCRAVSFGLFWQGVVHGDVVGHDEGRRHDRRRLRRHKKRVLRKC
jgi:hypothetical protein